MIQESKGTVVPVWLQQLDKINLSRRPLADHNAIALDQHDKSLYMNTLVQIVLMAGGPTAEQSRLLEMLQTAMGGTTGISGCLDSTEKYDTVVLNEFCQMCLSEGLGYTFLADILVLIRLRGKPERDQIEVLSGLCEVFKIDGVGLKDLVHVSDLVLSVPTDYCPSFAFGYDQVRVWHEFCYQELTMEHLKNGLLQGRWIVKEKVEVSWPWTIKDANVVFAAGASLVSNGDFVREVRNCGFFNGWLVLTDGRLSMENVEIRGQSIIKLNKCKTVAERLKVVVGFDVKNKYSIFDLSGCPSVDFKNCYFSTKNSRAMQGQNGGLLNIEGCEFDACGHPEMAGGAIRVYGSQTFRVSKSIFVNCVAKIGGAIRCVNINYNNLIEDSRFVSCQSAILSEKSDWNELGFYGGSIFSEQYVSDSSSYGQKIARCTFEDGGVNAGYGSSSKSYPLFKDCNFRQAPVRVSTEDSRMFDGCAFENAGHQNQVVFNPSSSEWANW